MLTALAWARLTEDIGQDQRVRATPPQGAALAYKRQRRGYWEAEDAQTRGVIWVFVVVFGVVIAIAGLIYSFPDAF
jgi:hypothetical protein